MSCIYARSRTTTTQTAASLFTGDQDDVAQETNTRRRQEEEDNCDLRLKMGKLVSSWLSFLFGLCYLNGKICALLISLCSSISGCLGNGVVFRLKDHVLADIWSFRIITESTTIMTTTQEPLYASGTPVACSVHENCTARIFSLDAYCCQSIGTCCNWFLYTSYFQ